MLRRVLAVGLLFAACTEPGPDPQDPWDPQDPPGPRDPDEPDDPPAEVAVLLENLESGWLVTTSRLFGDGSPATETTITSDGSPLLLVGTDQNVFVATITDATGTLMSTRAMKAPCTMGASRQLNVPNEYPTIQAAIDAAQPGETVKVQPGTYTESVKLREGVCLLGSGAKRTILDAQYEERTLVDLTGAPGSVVSGFTIRNTRGPVGCANADVFTCSGNWYRSGIYLAPSTIYGWEDATITAPPIIANNIFEDNYIGVMLYFHGIAVVRNNVFVGNEHGFVANHYQDRTLVANNGFVNNTALAIGNQAAYLDIIDNVIVGSQLGVRFEYIQTGNIGCNIFYGNDANSSDPDRFAIGTNGNIEAEPKFVGNGDYHLQPSSPGKDASCHHGKAFEPDGTAPDIGAFGGPLAVWTDL